jgi:hypothetical protein
VHCAVDHMTEDGIRIISRCAQRHPASLVYTDQVWRQELAAGKVRFFCLYCGESFPPSAEEQQQMIDMLNELGGWKTRAGR